MQRDYIDVITSLPECYVIVTAGDKLGVTIKFISVLKKKFQILKKPSFSLKA